jgi:hypothetical protein
MPSMIEAWLSASEMTASSGPNRDSKTPPLASKQLEKPGYACLQGQVQVLSAADEPHAGHAEAALVHRGLGRGDDLRVVREAEVVVGAEVHDLRAGLADLSGLDPVGLRGINVPLGLEQSGAADVVKFVLQLVLDC